ncbi:hypothetical protein [Chondrinema litorale]|uniref:hypothetical protein n=1 Tax=Chondrinema litorale TaxID=2994555 RepID=UPI0025427F84|nr:hypothetical protein [Chondrinema litorale]UZR94330.1 hypothetical protein OQ292_00680 [Chondrinema litorale]
MTKKLNLKLLALLFALFAFTACDDDDDIIPEEENEEEEITTVNLTFIDEDSNETVFSWQDLDGDGGDDAIVDDIVLESGKTYELKVELLNENESPAEVVTEEVEEEAVDHQFFFSGSAIDDLITINYNDSDTDGNPIGLDNNVTILTTGGPSILTVILRHQPDKTATGVSDGDIDNAGGETDVSVDFNITVQ